MTESEDTYLICDLAQLPPGIHGTIRKSCSVCERPIWVAPTGQQLLAKGAVPLCISCGMDAMAKDADAKINQLTPAQREEIRHAWGGGAQG